MIDKYYYEYVIDDIIEIIKTNISIYYNGDDSFFNLKELCKNKDEDTYQRLDYFVLISLVEEVLADLINCDYLYDFRALE